MSAGKQPGSGLASRLCLSCVLAGCIAFAISGLATAAYEPDMRNGRDINELCAGCHGEFGEGGKQGQYPRLAGLPTAFLARQLYLFRDRKRPNMAMIEYVDHRQMPDADIEDISAYLAAIELPSRIAPIDSDAPGFDAFARLQEAKRVLQIPTAEGDVTAGERLYRRECGSCHGRDGTGDHAKAIPMLAGQYTDYLLRQVEKYLAGQRIHDPDNPDERLLAEFTADELRNIFAYLSTVDD